MWWSEDIRIQVKEEKQAWRKYLNSKSQETYSIYKKSVEVNKMFREAKQKMKEFEVKLEKDSTGAEDVLLTEEN